LNRPDPTRGSTRPMSNSEKNALVLDGWPRSNISMGPHLLALNDFN